MTTKEKTKAKKTEIKLTDIQSAIVRKFDALSTKGADAYNGLTGFCQSTMEASVLFTDGYGWSDEAIEDLNTTLKAMQSKLERKSTGYATFASAKSTILKALRAGVADVRKPKDELAAETKKLTAKPESESESGESESGSKPEVTPAMLIQQALEMLVKSGDSTPVKTAQGLLILAGNNLKKKK